MYSYQMKNKYQIVIAATRGKSKLGEHFIYGLPTMLEKYKEHLVLVEQVTEDFVVDWGFPGDYDLVMVKDKAIYDEITSQEDYLKSFPDES